MPRDLRGASKRGIASRAHFIKKDTSGPDVSIWLKAKDSPTSVSCLTSEIIITWLGVRDSTLLRNPAPMVAGLRAAERHWRSRSNPLISNIQNRHTLARMSILYGWEEATNLELLAPLA